ncbi:2-oxoacid:acceptor oxidoreductase family protein [Streptomyces sp. NPDC018693]|uniref:2-oxoacid:acceptor oxidoreductase family protein n=1 Tax=unclassified Streptomyces TaxID=2593676 RepID=UPI0037AC3C85
MFQVRIHGRGGQSAVTTAEVLSVAAFVEGRHAQAFPRFGSERTGAPVTAFCRIDARPIRVRVPVMRPDPLVLQDPTPLHQVDVFHGLRPGGSALVNSPFPAEEHGMPATTSSPSVSSPGVTGCPTSAP